MKCSHRSDAIEKCTKKGDWYESFLCPKPDPTFICQAAKWYFSDTEPHETEMVAIRSVQQFGAMHGFTFEKDEVLQEVWDNYEKFGNNWGDKDWGLLSIEGGHHPRGFRLPVCVNEDNQYDPFQHQRPWQHNWLFPTGCGAHGANETEGFLRLMSLQPGSARHNKGDDPLYNDRILRVSTPTH